jgi:hypothetical protein
VFEQDLADLTAEPGRQIERWLGSQNAGDWMSEFAFGAKIQRGTMTSARGSYSLIQSRPDESRLESINIGVVLFSAEPNGSAKDSGSDRTDAVPAIQASEAKIPQLKLDVKPMAAFSSFSERPCP